MPRTRRYSQHGGTTMNIFYNKRQNLAVFDTDKSEIYFKNVINEAAGQYLIKSTVKIPFKLDEDKILVNKDCKTAEIHYFSDQGNPQALFKGSVIVTQTRLQDVPIINPLEGQMERYASSDQFAIVLSGYFGGSTKLKKGSISLINDDIEFTTDEFIYIPTTGPLQDIYMFRPEIRPLHDYDPERYNYVYKYAGHQHNNRAYISLKDAIKLRQRGTYEQLIDKYSKLMNDCKYYGQKKLNIHDQIINQTIVEGLCNIIYLEAIGNDKINVGQYFDKLVSGPIMETITKSERLKTPDYVHPYTKPNIQRRTLNEAYYRNAMYPMNIRLHPDELEILVPFDRDDKKHIYYQWVELGSNYNLYVDTGNHAISGMSRKYFETRYLQFCSSKCDVIKKELLDTATPPVVACGVGGESKCPHVGYIELSFRFKNAPYKGIFTIDCQIEDTDMYDLLIGDDNKSRSKLKKSNMKHLLTDNKIFLKYDP